MDEADRILIDTLISVGLEVADADITLENFSPDILIAATSLCLEIIFEHLNETQNFPKSCPVNMAARFKVGQVLSEALKSVGYKEAIGYQSFLYPNVRDTRSIISFLIEQLPKDAGSTVQDGGVNESDRLNNAIKQALSDSWSAPWLPHYCYNNTNKNAVKIRSKCLIINSDGSTQPSLQSQTSDTAELLVSVYDYDHRSRLLQSLDIIRLRRQVLALEAFQQQQAVPERIAPKIRKRTKFLPKEDKIESDEIVKDVVKEAEERLEAVQTMYGDRLSRFEGVLERLKLNQEIFGAMEKKKELLKGEIEEQRKESAIKEKAGIVIEHGEESVMKLESAIGKRERQIENITTQWRQHKEELRDKVANVEETQREKFSKTRELELQLTTIRQTMDNCRHDYQEKDSLIKLLNERVKQILAVSPAQSGAGGGNKQSRSEFTKRILELSENRKKQNSEIRKILADIFQLQKEINSLRGKLDRSFSETNDLIFANAKKDEASKKMYKVVISIHENCNNLVGVIEEKGRLLRDIRDLEMCVETENRENVERNLAKITVDFEEAKANVDKLKKKIRSCKQSLKT